MTSNGAAYGDVFCNTNMSATATGKVSGASGTKTGSAASATNSKTGAAAGRGVSKMGVCLFVVLFMGAVVGTLT